VNIKQGLAWCRADVASLSLLCVQVTKMKKVVQQKQVVVAQAKQDCEELLVEIVQDKRVADEQEKQVCITALTHACCGCFVWTDYLCFGPCNCHPAPAHTTAARAVESFDAMMQVNAEATKIAKETEDANIIAAQVAAELEKALPALQEAEAALNVLTKADISELKVSAADCW
jgi:dynein heavy chain